MTNENRQPDTPLTDDEDVNRFYQSTADEMSGREALPDHGFVSTPLSLLDRTVDHLQRYKSYSCSSDQGYFKTSYTLPLGHVDASEAAHQLMQDVKQIDSIDICRTKSGQYRLNIQTDLLHARASDSTEEKQAAARAIQAVQQDIQRSIELSRPAYAMFPAMPDITLG